MSDKPSKDQRNPHEHINREAEKFTAELESPFGAEKLGEEAYKTAQEDAAKNWTKL